MKHTILIICYLILPSLIVAQNTFEAIILDSGTGEVMIGATGTIKGSSSGATSGEDGIISLTNIPNGKQSIVISFIGYDVSEIKLKFPLEQTEPHKIYISESEELLDEVIIEATRANRSVKNLPTRTEV